MLDSGIGEVCNYRMGEEIALPESTVRAMVRLLGEVATLRGSLAEQRKHLMDGLCRLTGTDSWLWMMMGLIDTNKAPAATIFLRGGFSDRQLAAYLKTQEHPDIKWMTAPFFEAIEGADGQVTRTSHQINSPEQLKNSSIMPLFAEAGMEQVILSGRPTRRGQFGLIVMGRRVGREDYTLMEARIAHIVLSEVGWLHDESWPEHPREGISKLSPRLRSVLTLLVQGHSRKQIAWDLGISENTLGGYIKEIYSAFNVHSQAELLRRFVEGDGGDASGV